MKTRLISIGLIFLIFACNRTQRDNRVTDDTDKKRKTDSVSSAVSDPTGAIWKYFFNEQTEEFEIKQLRPVDRETLSGEALEKIINKSWPRVQIIFTGTSNDTAFISIPDSEALTQQMGSAGAESFMISTTFTFTELPGINKVSFNFVEGDHGVPGVYNRNSWDRNNDQ